MRNSPPTPAHPRSRGENFGVEEDSGLIDGSSPLTRGKRAPHQRARFFLGLIPAHAGKTVAHELVCVSRGAHPRSRGENFAQGIEAPLDLGSSPLTRGKPAGRPRPRMARGLIPAHAGKTSGGTGTAFKDSAHPRSRGENVKDAQEGVDRQGSSPLTRGKHVKRFTDLIPPRLIPAHAGKTLRISRPFKVRGAHPRSRGENFWCCSRFRPGEGSSPLTRGKRHARSARRVRARLIPAHAGKTTPIR